MPLKFSIGGLLLDNPVLLAPLAGVTIPSLRLLFSRLGAGAVHTEMISCAGLLALERGQQRARTGRMLSILDGEAPVIAQFFAGDAETLSAGVEVALRQQRGFAAVGINMACPMPKVLKKGAGSMLLERPGIAFEMVARLASLGLPVWPKIRKCPSTSPLSTESFCEGLLRSGAASVTVHGRTPAQRYEGSADASLPVRLAALFPGRICASGDIFTTERSAEYVEGGCVAVMLARGVIADPFLLPRTLAHLGLDTSPELLDPAPDRQTALLLEFGDSVCAEAGQRIAALMVKRLLSGMFRGQPGVGALRRTAAEVLSWEELRAMLEERETRVSPDIR